METLAYAILLVVAILWLIGIIAGMVAAFPFGIIGLVVIFAIGLLFIKVLKQRLESKEDDYYSKKVEK
jgi:hypothetical protein